MIPEKCRTQTPSTQNPRTNSHTITCRKNPHLSKPVDQKLWLFNGSEEGADGVLEGLVFGEKVAVEEVLVAAK